MERPDDHPHAPFIGGNHSIDATIQLYNAKADFFSKNYKSVPGLFSYMFDNTSRDPRYDMLQLCPDPSVHDWINLDPAHKNYPKALFLDSLACDHQSRTCGRYTVLSKIWNGRPAYFSRMARMYLYNNSDSAHDPEWAVSRRLGSSSFVVLIKGDIHNVSEMENAKIYVYDKFSDESHVRGNLSMNGLIAPPKGASGGSRKVRLSEGGGAKMFRRTAELARHSNVNFEAFVHARDVSVMPCFSEKEVKEQASTMEKIGNKQGGMNLVKAQNNVLQKEW